MRFCYVFPIIAVIIRSSQSKESCTNFRIVTFRKRNKNKLKISIEAKKKMLTI